MVGKEGTTRRVPQWRRAMKSNSAYTEPILDWYEKNARDLPWRAPDATPWGILVSEIMLQQTPVSRVPPVWRAWMNRWPTPAALAAEPSGEAVRAWGRLGYPRRALRLHETARAITERHGGEVPSSHADLLALPGIGAYTAAAVASFAFGQRHAVLDTNVRRVLARLMLGRGVPAEIADEGRGEACGEPPPPRPADGRPLGRGGHGTGRPGVHRPHAPLRRLPGVRHLCLAVGRPTRVRRTSAPRPDIRRHRPPVPWPPPRGPPGRRWSSGEGRPGLVWSDALQRERALDALISRRPGGPPGRRPLRPPHLTAVRCHHSIRAARFQDALS